MKGFSDIINSKIPTLVDFYADWCGPCKMQAPILAELSKRISGKAKIIKVDVDKNKKASFKYGINSIPTLILFQEGKIVWRRIGTAQLDELEQVINYHS